jgi:hypothetical protein
MNLRQLNRETVVNYSSGVQKGFDLAFHGLLDCWHPRVVHRANARKLAVSREGEVRE